MAITASCAACAERMPFAESSIAAVWRGSAAISVSARRYTSGAGLPRATSSAETTALKYLLHPVLASAASATGREAAVASPSGNAEANRASASSAPGNAGTAHEPKVRNVKVAADDVAGLVALARSQDRPSRIATALRLRGVEVVELHEGGRLPSRVPDLLAFPSSGSVAAARDYLASLRNLAHLPKVAAMGAQSGAAARDAGFAPDFTSPEASIEAFVASISEGLARE